MELTYKDVEAILKLIDGSEHLEEIEIVYNGFRLRAVRDRGTGQASPMVSPAPDLPSHSRPAEKAEGAGPAVSATRPAKEFPAHYTVIRAPMIGTFYRAPAPGGKPFVEVGQSVRAEDTVCLIEVMKLFNSIRAGADGKVVEILAENGALVEHDQPLVVIAPEKG